VSDRTFDPTPTIPPAALDDAGVLLGPDEMPLAVLLDPVEIIRSAQAVADLTHMECSALLYDPVHPRPVAAGQAIQFVNAPICRALNQVPAGSTTQCLMDVSAAAHAAMRAEKPVTANCIGGQGTLFACPIILCHDHGSAPKAAIVAAAHDVFRFHFADRLAFVSGRPVIETEDLMCRTDKRCLNTTQLQRIRALLAGQALSFSRQIADRYAELRSLATIVAQKETVTRAYEQLDSEFRFVGELQRSLVPSQSPHGTGVAVETYYDPAGRAGGDYYDFFPQPDGSLGILIADVSGHGPAAAVVMAMMRAILHTYPMALPSPGEVLRRTNDYLCDNIMSHQFVTAIFATLDTKTGRVRFASAGHNVPLFSAGRTGEVKELEVETGLPLGVIGDQSFSQAEVNLATGDTVLLYTDGVTDTRSPAGDFLGIPRLKEILGAHAASGAGAVRDAVVEAVGRFARGRPLDDDQTLIVVEKQ